MTVVLIAAGAVLLLGALAEGYGYHSEEQEKRHHPLQRAVMWLLAPFVERWQGLSLTRFIAIFIAAATVDVAHDLLELCKGASGKLDVPWSYVALLIGGLFLSVVTALGAKHIDKLIELVAMVSRKKLGIAEPQPEK